MYSTDGGILKPSLGILHHLYTTHCIHYLSKKGLQLIVCNYNALTSSTVVGVRDTILKRDTSSTAEKMYIYTFVQQVLL